MRILQINASYKPAYMYGGPTVSVSALAENMARAGNEVWVFTTTANGINELEVTTNQTKKVEGVNVIYFERLTKDHSHFSPALLSALNKKVKQFDVVHIHAWWNLVSVLSCLIAIMKGAKVVVSPRGTLSSYSFAHKSSLLKRMFHLLIGKRLLKNCAIHTTSSGEEHDMHKLIGTKQLFNISNFISLPPYSQNVAVSKNEPMKLLFLSRIDEKKGLGILIKGLAELDINWSLSIVGDGDKQYIESLKQLALSKKIDKHISWLGFRHDDKFDIYNQHDLFVLPSHNENFGNVVIESLCMGTPVLLSKNVGLADFVAEHDAGWLFDLNPVALRETIELAVSEKDKIARIKKTGRQLVEANFGTDVLINQYQSMYKQITGNE